MLHGVLLPLGAGRAGHDPRKTRAFAIVLCVLFYPGGLRGFLGVERHLQIHMAGNNELTRLFYTHFFGSNWIRQRL
jgi:hypothetical protein